MHQLRVAKHAIKVFKDMIQKKPENDSRKGHSDTVYYEIFWIGQNYGIMLTWQSKRNFPRTKFTSAILEDSRKNGKYYLGVIVCCVVLCCVDFANKWSKNNFEQLGLCPIWLLYLHLLRLYQQAIFDSYTLICCATNLCSCLYTSKENICLCCTKSMQVWDKKILCVVESL